MYLNRGGFNLRRQRRDRLSWVALYVILIMGGLYVFSMIGPDEPLHPIGVATATATRSSQSYSAEAEKQCSAGQLQQAVEGYKRAIEADPLRVEYRIPLAPLQGYAGPTQGA